MGILDAVTKALEAITKAADAVADSARRHALSEERYTDESLRIRLMDYESAQKHWAAEEVVRTEVVHHQRAARRAHEAATEAHEAHSRLWRLEQARIHGSLDANAKERSDGE